MRSGIFWLLLAVVFLLEVSIFRLPIVLDFLAIAYVYKKDPWVFGVAFLLGFLLDVLLVRPLGLTVAFFLISLFLIFLYERKYEVVTREFIFFFTLVVGFVYLWIFQSGLLLVMALVNALLAAVAFLLVGKSRHAIA